MFLVLLNFVKPLEEVDRWRDGHMMYLDKYIKENKFIFAGRRDPRTGGVLLVNEDNEEDVKKMISEDPFYIHQVAEFNFIKFNPVKYDERFSCFVNTN